MTPKSDPLADDETLAEDPRFANSGEIPRHLRPGLIRYLDHGILPGGFLQAVICNDLREACVRADDAARPRLWAIIRFLHWEAPAGSWGSPEALMKWVQWRKVKPEASSNG